MTNYNEAPWRKNTVYNPELIISQMSWQLSAAIVTSALTVACVIWLIVSLIARDLSVVAVCASFVLGFAATRFFLGTMFGTRQLGYAYTNLIYQAKHSLVCLPKCLPAGPVSPWHWPSGIALTHEAAVFLIAYAGQFSRENFEAAATIALRDNGGLVTNGMLEDQLRSSTSVSSSAAVQESVFASHPVDDPGAAFASSHPAGEALKWRIRGIGLDHCPGCFICGAKERHADANDYLNNISGFVETKADGEKLVSWLNSGGVVRARLDWRESEPEWIQVKVGACDRHMPYLEELINRVHADDGRVRLQTIIATKKTILPEPAFTK